jgi:cellulose biosynthesis protein BcsQ
MQEATGKILVAATGKGGAGKSTTVACLATFWHRAGRKVALIDCDPNQTLTRWHAKRNVLSEMTLRTELDEHAIIPTIAEMASNHDVVLVDCAGFGNQAMVFAIGAADLVLIPVMTDEANVFEALRTFKIVESASLSRGDLSRLLAQRARAEQRGRARHCGGRRRSRRLVMGPSLRHPGHCSPTAGIT